jgi:DNA helicase II / ATP-dependent DNA helicase PcrA
MYKRIAVDTLENEPSVGKKLQDQYSFFTVDGYQDVNPIQEKLIQLISNKQNVCAVGVDAQSTYQWRSADVKTSSRSKNAIQKLPFINLTSTGEAVTEIMKTADKLIQRNNPEGLINPLKTKVLYQKKLISVKLYIPDHIDPFDEGDTE